MSVRWVVFPTDNATCFGCGRHLRKSAHWKQVLKNHQKSGDPRFIFNVAGKQVAVCPICALLCAMKDNGNFSIREMEFNESTMANIHKKHKALITRRFRAGERFYDLLKEFYPQLGEKK